MSSPPGPSTLTTSAPRSASSIVAYGPARMREKSATSSPASGPRAPAAGSRPPSSSAAPPARSLASADVPSVPESRCRSRERLSTGASIGAAPTPLTRRPAPHEGGPHATADRYADSRSDSVPTDVQEETMTMSDAAPESGRPLVFRGGTVLTMDDAATVLTDADVLVVDDRIAAVGPGLDVPEGTQEIDATRRHRDARDDRHPPAHVADRDARLRRRLDAHPVLRLVLPRARQEVPPARTSRPATGWRRSSRSTPA